MGDAGTDFRAIGTKRREAWPSVVPTYSLQQAPQASIPRDTYFSVEILRLRIRDQSVVGFIPSSAAAPCLPYTWPLHCLKARSMLARSISLISVIVKTRAASSSTRLAGGFFGSRCLASPSSNSSLPPRERIKARSMTFCSSRILPGQS